MPDEKVVSLDQFRTLIKEGLLDAHGDRLDRLEDSQVVLEEKFDEFKTTLHAFEVRVLSCFNEMNLNLSKDMNNLVRETDLNKRENKHQCDMMIQTLVDISAKMKEIDGAMAIHEKRIFELEQGVEIVRGTTKTNIENLQVSLNNLEQLIDKDTKAVLKNLGKDVVMVKNMKTIGMTAVMVITMVLCLTIYFQDVWIKWNDIKERFKKGSQPVTLPVSGVKK